MRVVAVCLIAHMVAGDKLCADDDAESSRTRCVDIPKHMIDGDVLREIVGRSSKRASKQLIGAR